MRKKILSLLISTLILTSISTTAFASTKQVEKDSTAKVGTVMNAKQVKDSSNFLKQHPDLVDKYKELNKKSVQNKENTKVGILSASEGNGPASELTDYFTYYVGYKDPRGYKGEQIPYDGLESTKNDYNGTVYVITVEIGYGDEYIQFNGTVLSKYDIQPLDFDGDKVIDGFMDIWQLNNVTSGKFSSNSISMNGMNTNSIHTEINIR